MWRWLWTGSVVGIFILVVGLALEGAPPGDGELPVIAAADSPLKERLALPAVEEVVPRSTVLNLLAAPDDPAALVDEASPTLDRALAAKAEREREIADIEASLNAIAPGEPVAEPARRPNVDGGEPATAALGGTGRYRIQIAAVRPGQEQATFDELQVRYGSILGDLQPRFQAFSGESGVLVRIQAGPLGAEADAEARCRRLREAGGECFVVAAPG